MVNFRNTLFALAATALFACLTVPANAQSTCTVGSGVNTLVRAEGYNELVGDIVLTCTGGTPTAPNTLVPQGQLPGNAQRHHHQPHHCDTYRRQRHRYDGSPLVDGRSKFHPME
jgi:hypothetical protein